MSREAWTVRQQLEQVRMNVTESNVLPFGPKPKRQKPSPGYDDAA